MTDISGTTSVITGGASGIGRLLALRFARLGSTVILYDLDDAGLEAVSSEIEAATGRKAMSPKEIINTVPAVRPLRRGKRGCLRPVRNLPTGIRP